MLRKIYFFSLILLMFSFCGCEKSMEDNGFTINLDKTWRQKSIKSIDSLQQPLGILRFSPNGQYLTVSSSSDGQVHIIDVKKQKVAYEKDLGIGRFTVVAYSPDSKFLYIGEQSPDGNLYCYSLIDGKEVWQKKIADILGCDLAIKSYPAINDIKLDQKGHLYFVAGRISKKDDYAYSSAVYCLNAINGKELWRFPKSHLMDISSYLLAVDPNGKKLVVNTNSLNNSKVTKYKVGSIYILDGLTGKLINTAYFPSDELFKKAIMWYNVSISSDANRIGMLSNDGTGYLLNNQGRVIWRKKLAAPKEINSILLHASGRKCYFLNDKIIFSTSNTSDLGKERSDLVLEHPNSNTVFAYNLQGNLLWKWKGGGLLNEQRFSNDARYIVCSVANNCATRDINVHGVYLLKINKEKFNLEKVYRSKSSGPMVSADISGDGHYIAGLEVPVIMEDNISVLGKYQVHIWKK